MKNKELLTLHYNSKYPFKDLQAENIPEIPIIKYPRNRYEAAVFWAKGKGKALEIGAGSGIVANALSSYYEEYVVTELSSERVKYLKNAFKDNGKIKVLQNDIEEKNLEFSSGYFDTIIMVALVEHLIEPISSLEYCYSLLKPGGKIFVDTPNIAKWTRRLKLLFGFFPSTGSSAEGHVDYNGKPTVLHDDGHLHYFTFRSLAKILKERCGFSRIEYCWHGSNFVSRVVPALFSECCMIAVK